MERKSIREKSRNALKVCLSFGKTSPILKGFTDADMEGDHDRIKYTSVYLFTFHGDNLSCRRCSGSSSKSWV